ALLGFFQIGLAALVWVLLLPSQRQKIGAQTGDDVQALLGSPDPRVRGLAAEAAGHRGVPARYARGLVELTSDPNANVREQARAALARLAGSDPAAGVDEERAAQIWRDEAKRRGWLP